MTLKRDTAGKRRGDKAKVQLSTPTPKESTTIKPPMHDLLGDTLRAYYNKIASEPIPDRFEQLLKQLEAKTSRKDPD